MKKLSFILLSLFVLLGASYSITKRFISVQREQVTDKGKVQVVTSFYPMYFFAERIGGTNADVTNLTPAGSEPHDYDPSPQQIAKIQQSQLLIINGGGLEPWAEKIQQNLQGKKVVVVTASYHFITRTSAQDPHVWLSPIAAKSQVQKILTNPNKTFLGTIKLTPSIAF